MPPPRCGSESSRKALVGTWGLQSHLQSGSKSEGQLSGLPHPVPTGGWGKGPLIKRFELSLMTQHTKNGGHGVADPPVFTQTLHATM